MRVTGGELRGRRLLVPPRGVRPTADRVRESLFMVLRERLPGARVLDLCAGSGALGIEALSRGAEHCVFVEAEPHVAAIARKNLAMLGLEARSEVRVAPAGPALARFAASGAAFDLVLFDPPYAAPAAPLVAALAAAGILAPNGLIAWEHDRRTPVPADDRIEIADERRYGDTVVTLFVAAAAG
jgi:16S rRNA (guanine966-N2)-methyltransferase